MRGFELDFLRPVYGLNIDVGLCPVFAIIVLTRDIFVLGGGSGWAMLCYRSKDGLPAFGARSGHTPMQKPSNSCTLPSHYDL